MAGLPQKDKGNADFFINTRNVQNGGEKMNKNYLIIFVMAALLVCLTGICLANGDNSSSSGSKSTIPPGWEQGNKTGWNGEKMPPGLFKQLPEPATPEVPEPTTVTSATAKPGNITDINTADVKPIPEGGANATVTNTTETDTDVNDDATKTPPGWEKGKKTGWNGEKLPPGLFKKQSVEEESETDEAPPEGETPPEQR